MKLKFTSTSCIILLLLSTHILTAQNSYNDEMEQSVVKTYDAKSLAWGPCPEFMPEGCNVAVLHGDPAKDNSDVFFKIEPNSDIPEHWHNSAERMILISGELEVTYKGEQTQILKPGSYAYGPAKKQHSARCLDAGECILFIAFEGPVDAFKSEN